MVFSQEDKSGKRLRAIWEENSGVLHTEHGGMGGVLQCSGNVALLKVRAGCCPSLGMHRGPPRDRPLGLDVAQQAHRGLEALRDTGGKMTHTRGPKESWKGYFL